MDTSEFQGRGGQWWRYIIVRFGCRDSTREGYVGDLIMSSCWVPQLNIIYTIEFYYRGFQHHSHVELEFERIQIIVTDDALTFKWHTWITVI